MKREPLVEDIQDYALNIVDTVREPLLILDATLRVRSANRAFYQTFQVSAEETVDRLIYELGNGQWDIPDLRRLLEDIVPKSSVFNDFELEHTFPVIGRRVMLLNARKLQAGQHGELLVLAEADFDVFLTADQNLRYQQNLSGRRIAIIELPTNTLSVVKTLVHEILKELTTIGAGDYVQIKTNRFRA